MTDRERAEALAADIPLEASQVRDLAVRAGALEEAGPRGDGTLDLNTWKHVRNLAWALRDLSKVLTALEQNTDPDDVMIIPF